ncbi:hypothetical protein [Mesorhizobium sp. J428]|uniref:DUF6941 family protein n=1 Tax=Mesorhizobium sp. J428 TaxID=2898440 RepID=UPI0021513BE8|nr:hypothetical protein [Mesorhizobium sp. J428]MCR5859751.1 hypothetical protein [Mesorhizobium sp. J428]
MTLLVEAIVVCDEVRKEITGKDIIIGAYGDGIVVPAYPANITIALWVLINSTATGNYEGELRIEAPSDNPPINVGFAMNVVKPELSPMGISGMPLRLERDGELVVSFRLKGEPWKRVARRSVIRIPSAPQQARRN